MKTDDGALKLIIDALDESKRAVNSLNARLYEQQEARRSAEYRAGRLIKALDMVCSTLRTEGICNGADCETDACSINPLCAKSAPACREQQANDEESAELNRELCIVRAALDAAEERVKRLAEALRPACAKLLQERGCYEGECGTDACSYRDCVVGPALKLLESLEREVRSR